MVNVLAKTLIPAFGLLMLAGPAFADAIDGNWCHTDGRRFTIHGPEIVTPAGTRMQGDYNRHGFSYMPAAPEPGAGQTVFMTLANENTVYLRHGEAVSAAPPEVWVRCSPSISSIGSMPPA
jgi:hypothetical protein